MGGTDMERHRRGWKEAPRPLSRHAASFDLSRGKEISPSFLPSFLSPSNDNRSLLFLFARPLFTRLRAFLRNERNRMDLGWKCAIRFVDSRAFISSTRCVTAWTENVITSGSVLSRRIRVHVTPHVNRSPRFTFFLRLSTECDRYLFVWHRKWNAISFRTRES